MTPEPIDITFIGIVVIILMAWAVEIVRERRTVRNDPAPYDWARDKTLVILFGIDERYDIGRTIGWENHEAPD